MILQSKTSLSLSQTIPTLNPTGQVLPRLRYICQQEGFTKIQDAALTKIADIGVYTSVCVSVLSLSLS